MTGHRQALYQQSFGAVTTLHDNEYAVDTSQEQVTALDDDLCSPLDAYGQRVAHGVYATSAPLLPARVVELGVENL